MPQMDISRIRRSLTWLSEKVECLTPGGVQWALIEEQVAHLRAMLLPEGQVGDCTPGRSVSLVAEGELLKR